MQVQVSWDPEVMRRFPKLAVCVGTIAGVRNVKENEQIRQLKKAVYEEVRAKHRIETLKGDLTVRAFRDFYWKLNIDPTKTRPSGEALLRRVLHGKELPTISTIVDAYNLGSMKTIIPISGFDIDHLNPPLHVRFAESWETFKGIGMSKPMPLEEKMLVLSDKSQVLCIYPYRDADRTKITMQTGDAVIIGYGAPGIANQQLEEAVQTTLAYVKQVARGEIEMAKVFSC
jgi:DNA/RNA-binding domain of Phe-tRNA-synthetase-like protein